MLASPTSIQQLRATLDALGTQRRGRDERVATGWGVADGWLGGGLLAGCVHEWFAHTPPCWLAAHVAARASRPCQAGDGARWVVCIGREAWPSPHALLGAERACGAAGLLGRTLLIDPRTREDRLWSIEVALRCEGLVVVADASGVDTAGTRRWQLGAETAGSIGVMLRPRREEGRLSVATTRWVVEPAPSPTTLPRWRVSLSRCKGVQSGHALVTDDRSIIVELDDAGGLVCVDAHVRERRDAAAAAS